MRCTALPPAVTLENVFLALTDANFETDDAAFIGWCARILCCILEAALAADHIAAPSIAAFSAHVRFGSSKAPLRYSRCVVDQDASEIAKSVVAG